MTIADQALPTRPQFAAGDLYRDIHKGIRAELFSVTTEAGRADPSSGVAVATLSAHVLAVIEMLESHAGHEDSAIQPVLESHLPVLFEKIASDHQRLERRTSGLRAVADTLATAGRPRPGAVGALYLELANFTGIYLHHQDFEERVVHPALVLAVGPEAVQGIHTSIVSSVPPDQMARSLAVMLPAMNIDGRAEMLESMRASAPPGIFEGVWALAASVLAPDDHPLSASDSGWSETDFREAPLREHPTRGLSRRGRVRNLRQLTNR